MNLTGVFVIVANSIGAGLFGIPITSCLAGFFPSMVVMLFIALYMSLTASLIIKISFAYNLSDIINITKYAVNKYFYALSVFIFFILFSSILSAYLSKCADLSKIIFDSIIKFDINKTIYYCFIILITIAIINFKNTQFNNINSILIIMFLIILILLLYALINNVNKNNLTHYNVNAIKYTYPMLITSFGFHNILPYIKNLNYSYYQTKNLIKLGVIITFFVYFIWIFIVLSIIPFDNNEILSAYNYDKIITELIINYIDYKFIYLIINMFAFFAILTSMFGVSLSIKLFLENLLVFKDIKLKKYVILLIIFLPPVFINLTFKNIFFNALNLSGGVLALLLFGLLPCLIIFINKEKKFNKKTLFKSGILTIISLLAIIFFIISHV